MAPSGENKIASDRGAKVRLYVMFAIAVFATAFGNLSQTAVSAMIGGIDSAFDVDAGTGQWLTTAYMLVLGITVPAVPAISRRTTTRTLMLAALGLFLVGSLMGVFGQTFWVVLVGRILQAISAGITMPLLQAIAMVRFPPGRQATAMGVAGIALGFAPNIGPVLGGALEDLFGWRSFFVLLVVASIVLMIATVVGIDSNEKGSDADAGAKLDSLSLVYSTLGFGGILLAFSNASSVGFADPVFWGPTVCGIVFVVLFFARQRHLESPLINLRIFSARGYRSAMYVQCALMTSYLGITLLLSLYWQDGCGGSALESGLIFIPATIFSLVLNPIGGLLSDKYGVRLVAIIGGTSMAVGAVAAIFMDTSTPLWLVALIQTVRGAGMSLLIGPTMSFGLAKLPGEITMDGSSFLVLIRQACASIGTACMVLIVSAFAPMAAAGAVASAMPYQLAFTFSAFFALLMWFFIFTRIK